MSRVSVKNWVAIALVSIMAAGCKQGRGEHCQVDADCANGLSCSQAEPRTCGGGDQSQIDAYVFPDGPSADSPSADSPSADSPRADAP